MNARYRDEVARRGAAAITHVGLVDSSGAEISGGRPAYARQPATWSSPRNGTVRLAQDLVFAIPPGASVAGWRGYSERSDGVDFGGADLTTETFSGQGEYRLLAGKTGISHE